METNFEVKVVGVKYTCDKCKEGEMIYQAGIGTMLLTSPPQFEHTCTNCEFKQNLSKKYPTIEYKGV
ncbi:hypothetical protein ACUN13_29580 [Bacillus cereus group sp. Bce041]|uniref:hypothetical protein n=1 Tax=Bacillus cereus group sp. Bce041 TaxID=3445228 RepID=UPI004041A0A3